MPKTSSAFLKRDEYIENKKLLLNLSGIKDFSRIERKLSKTFLTKTIVSLVFTFIISGMIRQPKKTDFTLPPFRKHYTGNYISKFTLLYFMYITSYIISPGLCYNACPFIAEILNKSI